MHGQLSSVSRATVAKEDLQEFAAAGSPTAEAAAAWGALFPQSTEPEPHPGKTNRSANQATVAVQSEAGDAGVVLVRENRLWKVDLLKTLNAARTVK